MLNERTRNPKHGGKAAGFNNCETMQAWGSRMVAGSQAAPAERKLLAKPAVVSSATSRKMSQFEARGVTVRFPFEPYPCQKGYMERVIEALQDRQNALLESPTGTGKASWLSLLAAFESCARADKKRCVSPPSLQTLCLLCSSLAWQEQQTQLLESGALRPEEPTGFLRPSASTSSFGSTSTSAGSASTPKGPKTISKIIYASRTHTQLSQVERAPLAICVCCLVGHRHAVLQVIQELKSSGYSPKISVLGSREQLCAHTDVSQLRGTSQSHACRSLTKSRRCGWLLSQYLAHQVYPLQAMQSF